MSYTEQQTIFAQTYVEQGRLTGDRHKAGRAALAAAGYSENTQASTVIRATKELIIEYAQLELVKDVPKVLNKMEEVIDNPATPGAKNTIALVNTWLDRIGIIKKEESTLNIKTPDGVLILPPKNKET